MTLPSQTAGPLVTRCIEPAPKPEHPGMSWAELARKEGHFRRLPKNEKGGREVAPSYDAVLGVMQEAGPIGTADLSARTGLTRQTVTNIMTRMLRRDLVTRTGSRRYALWTLK